DHTIHGTTLVPGTALLDLALHATHHTGHNHIEELTLHSPVVLPDGKALRLRLTVETDYETDDDTGESSSDASNGSGKRASKDAARPSRQRLTLHSQPEDTESSTEWSLHVTGTLIAAPAALLAENGKDFSIWPPTDASPVDTTDLYDRLADLGLPYGPTFQGLKAAWRSGDTLYAEVQVPEGTDTTGYSIHPALLDAALHSLALVANTESGTAHVPFSWSNVALHSTGTTALRVRLTPSGTNSSSLEIADHQGSPVATIGAIATRPLVIADLTARSAATNSLFQLTWNPISHQAASTGTTWAVVGAETLETTELARAVGGASNAQEATPVHHHLDDLIAAVDAGAAAPTAIAMLCAGDGTDPAAAAHELDERVLLSVRSFLSADALKTSRLVVVTRSATSVSDQDEIRDLAASSVHGLIRTAQSENPDRIVLVDTDGHESSMARLSEVVGLEEPQLALRAGTLHAPRLTRATLPTKTTEQPLNPNGTTLITGGTGTLG
ncbi:polyketide synthase dehydratase domain-containing protein, partial [Streptomyces sp. NPDC050504]|uniref:polyketide synthase dehydratase domain-containing protein n=1 Tax=Streptomyces sp. NPDC050504 TaxID=3365618 RepID=UPI0037B91B80